MAALEAENCTRKASGWRDSGPKAHGTSNDDIVAAIECKEVDMSADPREFDTLLNSNVQLMPHQLEAIRHAIRAEREPLWKKFWSSFKVGISYASEYLKDACVRNRRLTQDGFGRWGGAHVAHI